MQGTDDDDIMDVTVALDGTWAERGFTAHFEIVFICPGKQGRYLTMGCYPSTVMSASYMKESTNPVSISGLVGKS